MCPLDKSGDEFNSQIYRPISLLLEASKLLEKIFHHQLVAFFADHPDIAALPPEQFPYHAHHKCECALTLVIDNWNRAVDNDECCNVVFCGTSKAFGRVKHALLIEKLASIGCSGAVLR